MTDEKTKVQFRYLEIEDDDSTAAKECAKQIEDALRDRSRKKLAEESGT